MQTLLFLLHLDCFVKRRCDFTGFNSHGLQVSFPLIWNGRIEFKQVPIKQRMHITNDQKTFA